MWGGNVAGSIDGGEAGIRTDGALCCTWKWPVAALANVLAGRQRCRLLWRQQSRQTYHWQRVMAGTRKALA